MTNTPSSDAPVSIQHLSVSYPTPAGRLHAVSDLSLEIGKGQILGIVGESGSGKTTVAAALLGLLDHDVVDGRATMMGTDVLRSRRREISRLRRYHMAAILQDPLGSLNPVRTVRSQLLESARTAGRSDNQAVCNALTDVGLDAARVLRRYPHELSGGMNQRVAIAMALLKSPELLVADEPTSALDVRTQAAIMRLILKIRAERDTSVLLITHDLELALGSCDTVAVLYAGRLVESGVPDSLRQDARHPYTKALLESSPRFGERQAVRSIPGRFSAVFNHDPGCPFRSRCPRAESRCSDDFPPAEQGATAYWCWNPLPAQAATKGRSA